MRTLGSTFDPRWNSLNALRLAFATAVIVAHSWPLSGHETLGTTGPPYNDLGSWAVAGFFAISGYLITSSRDHVPLGSFLWRRFLRIYPAFIVVLLMTALVFAPLSTIFMGEYSITAALTYVVKNLALYPFTYDISGTLTAVPYASTWNGSLWTLFFEAVGYVAIGIGMSLLPRKWLGPTLIIVVIGGMSVTAAHDFAGVISTNLYLHTVRLGTYFAAGSLIFVYRERIAMHWAIAACSVAVLAGAWVTETFDIIGALPIAYLCMWLGVNLPLYRVGSKNDISYGMYIYAFPVQQLLAIIIVPHASAVVFMFASIACTIPFAWASWLAVERPAMRLRSIGQRSTRALPGAAAPTAPTTARLP
ncbi:acyltransferase family protein [Devriesea agamarum]|uniref:acyltransferase family protein n=1 Tax=Devriesea agamarum TaxID=472569 RepID=UPI00071DD262|nr:acyltransferase [Devriesea agamarum]